MLAFFDGLLKFLHIAVCAFLIFVVLLQQGRGGGMGAAFGGGMTNQVFGGSGAGNILTRATAICAFLFMVTAVGLAYRSTSRDTSLDARLEQEKQKKAERGTKRERDPSASATTPAPPPNVPLIDMGDGSAP